VKLVQRTKTQRLTNNGRSSDKNLGKPVGLEASQGVNTKQGPPNYDRVRGGRLATESNMCSSQTTLKRHFSVCAN